MASKSEQQVIKALKDMVVYAAPDGTQDDGDFVGFYVLPTGPVHRAIATLQNEQEYVDTMGDVAVISRYQAHLKQLVEAEASRREDIAYRQAYRKGSISGKQALLDELEKIVDSFGTGHIEQMAVDQIRTFIATKRQALEGENK